MQYFIVWYYIDNRKVVHKDFKQCINLKQVRKKRDKLYKMDNLVQVDVFEAKKITL